MGYVQSKTDWKADEAAAASDLNRIEGNINAIVEEDLTLRGEKTFPDGIHVDTIDDVSGNGVTISGVRLKDGTVYGMVWGA